MNDAMQKLKEAISVFRAVQLRVSANTRTRAATVVGLSMLAVGVFYLASGLWVLQNEVNRENRNHAMQEQHEIGLLEDARDAISTCMGATESEALRELYCEIAQNIYRNAVEDVPEAYVRQLIENGAYSGMVDHVNSRLRNSQRRADARVDATLEGALVKIWLDSVGLYTALTLTMLLFAISLAFVYSGAPQRETKSDEIPTRVP